MNVGETVKVLEGAFKGMEGEVLHIDRDDITLRIVIFGRSTEVRVNRRDIHDPDADPRDYFWQTIASGIDNWWLHLELEWWQTTVDPTWNQYLEARTQMHAEREAVRARIREQFDAVLSDEVWNAKGATEIRERWDNHAIEWQTYTAQWKQIVEERRARIKENPDYVHELEAARVHGLEQRQRAYQMDFDERYPIDPAQDQERREASLREAMIRYHQIKGPFEQAFLLKLPQQTAVFWAFWISLDPIEREAAEVGWRYPAGIMDWFSEDFESRTLIDGLDHRLHFRYRSGWSTTTQLPNLIWSPDFMHVTTPASFFVTTRFWGLIAMFWSAWTMSFPVILA